MTTTNGFDPLLDRQRRIADQLRAAHQPRAATKPAPSNQHREASPVLPTHFPLAMPLWQQAAAADEQQPAAQHEQDDRAKAEAAVYDHLRAQLDVDIEAEVERRVQARLQPTARAWVDGSTWSPQPQTQPPEPRQLNEREAAAVLTSPEPARDPAAADAPAPSHQQADGA